MELISGTSDNGNDWEKQSVVFKEDGKERCIVVEFYGQKKTALTKQLQPRQLCEVTYYPRSREYGEGRWFTTLEGSKVTMLQHVEEQE